MLGFAADRSWWLAAVTGLALSAAVALWLPGVLSGSRLHGREVWLSCVLWQPLLEEVFFRGILQGELLNRPWARWRWQGVSVANLLCSMAFSAVHFLHHPPLWAASVFLPSLLFGWMRERHHGIGASLALHSLFNLEFFLAAALVPL
jgi:membrane protease YdiL (CAAX protease family)